VGVYNALQYTPLEHVEGTYPGTFPSTYPTTSLGSYDTQDLTTVTGEGGLRLALSNELPLPTLVLNFLFCPLHALFGYGTCQRLSNSWPGPIPHLQHDLQYLYLAVKPMLHASLAGLKILLLEQVNMKCCTIRYLSLVEAERARDHRDSCSDEYPWAP